MTEYHKTVFIPQALADLITKYLTTENTLSLHDEGDIVCSATFPDRAKMDIEFYGCGKELAHARATLHCGPGRGCWTKPDYRFLGDWRLEYEGTAYTVTIAVEPEDAHKEAGDENGAAVYRQIVYISRDLAKTVDSYLSFNGDIRQKEEDFFDICTVTFPDGKRMEIECVGPMDDDTDLSSISLCLLDKDNNVLDWFGNADRLLGDNELKDGDTTYIVTVAIEDDNT